jgi:hypothetical protein
VISVTCTACGKKLQVRDEFAGQTGQCPACACTLQIPAADTPLEEVPLTSRLVELGESEPEPDEPSPSEAPPEEEPLRDHAGGALSAGADFFVPPPSEIGSLLSCDTTLRQGYQPLSLGARILRMVLGAAGGVLAGVLIDIFFGVKSDFWRVAWPLGLGLLALGFSLNMTRFTHTCTFVGTEGVGRFVCSGSREHLSTEEVFCFRDATDLRTSTTLHYTNGVYQNTNYSYVWTDVGGRRRYAITGSHSSEAGTPPTSDPYYYALAAEAAWTFYLLQNAYRQVTMGNTVLFNLKSEEWIRLGEGLIVFSNDGQPEEWEADEVRGATIQQGVVRILRKDAKEGWFSTRGVRKFSFDQMANAQLFFHMMEKVVGVPVN